MRFVKAIRKALTERNDDDTEQDMQEKEQEKKDCHEQ
jgi:Sec-independent protein translocase protein TatA